MMSKATKLIYWISTLWLSLGMLSTGIVQLLKIEDEVNMITHLGYPTYFLTLLGVWKVLGVVAILVPKYPIVKEWAYAGFFIAMSSAIVSHLVFGDSFITLFGPALLLALTGVSWYYRPSDRKAIVA